jgi:hypothetical protein
VAVSRLQNYAIGLDKILKNEILKGFVVHELRKIKANGGILSKPRSNNTMGGGTELSIEAEPLPRGGCASPGGDNVTLVIQTCSSNSYHIPWQFFVACHYSHQRQNFSLREADHNMCNLTSGYLDTCKILSQRLHFEEPNDYHHNSFSSASNYYTPKPQAIV